MHPLFRAAACVTDFLCRGHSQLEVSDDSLTRVVSLACLCAGASGCAHYEFDADKGLVYYEPVPYFFVSTTAECISTATFVMLPGERKRLKFVDGYGSANLTVTLDKGLVSVIGQNVDAKVSDTITSLANLRTAFAAATAQQAGKPTKCEPTAILYRFVGKEPSKSNPIDFPVKVIEDKASQQNQ